VIQGDALNLPVKTGSVDSAFSIGVLHHTPAPENGVREACRALKPGGWFACAVYGKDGYYDLPQVRLWRGIFRKLEPIAGRYPPLAYSLMCAYGLRPIGRVIPMLGKMMRLGVPFVNLPDRRWSLLDTFDSVTPTYQSAHTSREVYLWFKSAGLAEIEPSDWSFTAYRGRKVTRPGG
jgi:SAM-dependent methyltransferase